MSIEMHRKKVFGLIKRFARTLKNRNLFGDLCGMIFSSILQRGTIYGEPKRVEHMGDTEIPYSIFFDFVLSLSENAFR